MKEIFIRIWVFLLVFLSFSAMGLDLPTGEISCQYTYTDSEDENESYETRVKFENSEDARTMFAEFESSDMDGSNKRMEFISLLEIPYADKVKLNEEVSSGFDTITIKKFSENKRKLRFTYELFGHWYNESLQKVEITKDKKIFKIVIKSKSEEGDIFDGSVEKFSSTASYICVI